VWERADAAPGGPDDSSLEAVRYVTNSLHRPFTRVFAHFGAANAIAHKWYSEGSSYPQPPLARTFTLTSAKPAARFMYALNHLTNASVMYQPGPSLQGDWKLNIALNLPDRVKGSAATVAVHHHDGTITWYRVMLNAHGDRVLTIPFSPATVVNVTLTLTNAGHDYTCWQGMPLACQGVPLDDNLKDFVRVQAVQ
jgi:hypothetical protein